MDKYNEAIERVLSVRERCMDMLYEVAELEYSASIKYIKECSEKSVHFMINQFVYLLVIVLKIIRC